MKPGEMLGPYRVVSELGEGGMGEVYRARDTKLDRDVALKILPESFASDPDRLMRFEREAKTLAALNHPNIAAIYGLEEMTPGVIFEACRPKKTPGVISSARCLVMELVDGEDLSERIARGPMALDEALPIARQIVDALETAHEAGIVHRDLKPANIRVREDGTVKVLDFGLAKAMAPPGEPSADMANSPTMTSPAMPFGHGSGHPEHSRGVTAMGMILGTAAYMSPEQAKGKHVDKRADIWAFGAVLFEMLTGRRLFDGETVSDTVAAVLRAPIDLSLVPAAARRAVERCLHRDPKQRLRDIGDWPLLLDDAAGAEGPAPAQPSGTAGRLWPALTAISAAAALVMAVSLLNRPAPDAPELLQFEIPGRGQELANAISPDGRQVAYVVTPTGSPPELWVRSLGSLEGRAVAGTEGLRPNEVLVWSPDSRSVAFSTRREIYRVDLAADRVSLVTSLPPFTGFGYGVAPGPGGWSADGTLIYGELGSNQRGGVWAVPETGGGAAVQVTRLRGSERSHSPSSFLPDGRRFLYLVSEGVDQPVGIRIGSLDLAPEEQDSTLLLSTDGPALHAPATDGGSGHIVFVSRGNLIAQPFDPEAGRLAGDAVTVAAGVGSGFSVSTTGRLVYRAAGEVPEGSTTLVRRDRTGRSVATIGEPARYAGVGRFPDGSRVTVARRDPGANQHGFIVDLARDLFTRPSSGPDYDGIPVPARDDRIAYTYSPEGPGKDIYVRQANGAGDATLLLASDLVKHPNDWSPDSQWLIFDVHTEERFQDLQLVHRDGGDPVPFLESEADESFGQFSPDGRWIAYYSRESGSSEVYVRDFAPDRRPAHGSTREQISVDGGDKPRWSADGREIFFLRPDGMLVAVPVTPGPPFLVGAPEELFRTETSGYMPYVAMPDGTFVINTPIEIAPEDAPPMVVMVNWQDLLRRQGPGRR